MPQQKKIEGLCLTVAFAFLWLPLGQQDFLYAHWMKVGTFMMPFLVFIAASYHSPDAHQKTVDTKTIALMLLCLYIIHQFEEHWIDLFGNTYAFQDSINDLVKGISGAPLAREGPLSSEAIFVINTALVWLVGATAIWTASDNVFPTLAMISIVLVNGIVHIVSAVVTLSYNPGLLTSCILFLPASWFAFSSIVAPKSAKSLAIYWAVIAHILMALGMMASTWWGIVSPVFYYFVLVGWALLPLGKTTVRLRVDS